MQLPPFLLDHWLAAHQFATPPIRYNIASSTGPTWTLGELLAIGDRDTTSLDEVALSYAPPQGSRALREQVAGLYGVDPDWVIITTGANEAVLAMYCLVAERDGSIVVPAPMFPTFRSLANAWSLQVSTYQLDRHQAFVQTAELVLRAVDDSTRLVLVNTPHNPTGSIMPAVEVQRLATALAARGIPLLVDEVYHPLYFGAPLASAANVPDVTLVSDLSKALSLPGLRTGWLIERDAERRKRLIDIRSYFTISGSPLCEMIATCALRQRDLILARVTEVTRTNLSVLEQFMHAHRNDLAWIPPAGGTVTFPWRRDGRNTRSMCEAVARAGVLIAPGDCFDAPDHFRIGLGAQVDGFADALGILSRNI